MMTGQSTLDRTQGDYAQRFMGFSWPTFIVDYSALEMRPNMSITVRVSNGQRDGDGALAAGNLVQSASFLCFSLENVGKSCHSLERGSCDHD